MKNYRLLTNPHEKREVKQVQFLHGVSKRLLFPVQKASGASRTTPLAL